MSNFFGQYWDAETVAISRKNHEYFGDVLNLESLKILLFESDFTAKQVQLNKETVPVAVEEYTNSSGCVMPEKLLEHWKLGFSFILHDLGDRVPNLKRLYVDLAKRFKRPLLSKVYITPAGNYAYKPHFDSHDLFVLQIAGKKDWKFYESPRELPLFWEPVDKEMFVPGEITKEVTLETGDLLFVPRGKMHSAIANDSFSVHITIGVSAFTWTDVFFEILRARALRDERLRMAALSNLHCMAGENLGLTMPDADIGIEECHLAFEDLVKRGRPAGTPSEESGAWPETEPIIQDAAQGI